MNKRVNTQVTNENGIGKQHDEKLTLLLLLGAPPPPPPPPLESDLANSSS